MKLDDKGTTNDNDEIRCFRNLLGLALLAMLASSPAAVAQSAAGKPEVSW